MSIGGNQLPFRLRCGGVAGVIKSLLGFPCHTLADEVPAFGNTTEMLDHCGNTIPAKKRLYQQDVCGDFICVMPDCSDCPGGEDLIINTPEPPKISENTFEESGTVQLDVSEKLGMKLAQAFKAWHGEFGFTYNPDGTACISGAPSNTKYRTREITASYFIDNSDDPPGAGPGCTYETNRTYTVARNSGIITNTVCTDTVSAEDCFDNPPFDSDFPLDPRCLNELPSVATYFALCDTDLSSGIGGVSGTLLNGDGDVHISVTSVRTETSYSWEIKSILGAGATHPRAVTLHYTGSITLTDAYTINDLLEDAATLADENELTDDLKSPFRTDKHTTVGPVTVRNELPAVSPNIFEACDWTDPNTDIYDGAVIGAPLAAGYGQPVGGNPRGVFDKDHENWERAFCDPPSIWEQAPVSRGGFTPSYLPANAPKWTDDFTATTLWSCNFINADTSGVYLQKWCEVKLKRPSINFARPFGPDKFALDETIGFVFYVSDFTAGVVTLQNLDFTTPLSLPFTTGDIVGSARVGGFFAVTSVGTDTVTLGALVIDLPAGWDTPSGDGSDCFGKLRYPDAPGMNFTDTGAEVGGRVRITVTNGSPVTLTTSTVQKYLSVTTAENIDILDANMTALATNVAATRVDDSNFTVPTAFATISGARWIVPHLLNDGSTSGQKYKFADTRSKGDYVYRTWTIRMIDEVVTATTQQDACLPSSVCGGPVVAGSTPNGETAANSHYFAFPTSINNGEVWLGQIQFWMQDPFWQQPHIPVAATDELTEVEFEPGVDLMVWTEDDGSCQPNFTEAGGGGETIFHRFYPMRPYVEARCTLPDNIDGETPPALASGVDLTAVQDPPPQAILADAEGLLVDAIIVPTPNWTKMLTQRGCVDAVGRFATDYEDNGTTS